MLNFQPNLTDPRALQTNQLATARHVNDDHYVRGFTPGEFVIGGAAVPTFVQITAAGPRWSAISMPDGDDSTADVSWRKPSEWRSGQMRTRFWYTASVGSTNNFVVQIRVQAIRDGEVVPGTDLVNNVSAVPGPAVANTLIRSSYVYTTVAMSADDELFSWLISRAGSNIGDTNVNALQLVYVEVEHIPAQQVSQ